MGEKYVMCFINGQISEKLVNFKSFKAYQAAVFMHLPNLHIVIVKKGKITIWKLGKCRN
jgi:hypothetical protein